MMNILVHVYATISYSVGNLAIVVVLAFWGSFVVAFVTFLCWKMTLLNSFFHLSFEQFDFIVVSNPYHFIGRWSYTTCARGKTC